MADTTMVLRKAHGHMHAKLQEKVRKLRAVLRIALTTAPLAVRQAAAPLVKGVDLQAVIQKTWAGSGLETKQALRFARRDGLRADLASRGFFGRMAWAVGYVVFGIGGTQ